MACRSASLSSRLVLPFPEPQRNQLLRLNLCAWGVGGQGEKFSDEEASSSTNRRVGQGLREVPLCTHPGRDVQAAIAHRRRYVDNVCCHALRSALNRSSIVCRGYNLRPQIRTRRCSWSRPCRQIWQGSHRDRGEGHRHPWMTLMSFSARSLVHESPVVLCRIMSCLPIVLSGPCHTCISVLTF